MAGAYRVQVPEWLIDLAKPLIAFEAAALPDDLVQLANIGIVRPHRQAELVHAAPRAARLQRADVQAGSHDIWQRLTHFSVFSA
jgi:hypothetical protein